MALAKSTPTDRPPLTGPIFGLYADRSGTLWIGTRGSGITLFNNGTFTPFQANPQLSNATVRSIYQDRSGNIWFGTNNGLNLWKDGKLTVFTKKDGLTDNFIYCSLEDHSGNIWFGTFTGLTIYRDGKFSAVPNAGSLNEQSIWALHEDAVELVDRYIWRRYFSIQRWKVHDLIANKDCLMMPSFQSLKITRDIYG